MDISSCVIYNKNYLSYALIENNYKFDFESRQLNISFEKPNQEKIIINEIIILLENFIPTESNLFSYIDIEFIVIINNKQTIINNEQIINSFRLYYDFFKEYITSDGANKIIKIPFYKIFNHYHLKKYMGFIFINNIIDKISLNIKMHFGNECELPQSVKVNSKIICAIDYIRNNLQKLNNILINAPVIDKIHFNNLEENVIDIPITKLGNLNNFYIETIDIDGNVCNLLSDIKVCFNDFRNGLNEEKYFCNYKSYLLWNEKNKRCEWEFGKPNGIKLDYMNDILKMKIYFKLGITQPSILKQINIYYGIKFNNIVDIYINEQFNGNYVDYFLKTDETLKNFEKIIEIQEIKRKENEKNMEIENAKQFEIEKEKALQEFKYPSKTLGDGPKLKNIIYRDMGIFNYDVEGIHYICQISFDRIKNNSDVLECPNCTKIYNFNPMKQWLAKHNRCPNCQQTITELNKYVFKCKTIGFGEKIKDIFGC